MFEMTFRTIDEILRRDARVSTELDYIEQASWILFLKYLDAFEVDRANMADLDGRSYSLLLDKKFRWGAWAVPLGKDAEHLPHGADCRRLGVNSFGE